MRMYTLSDCASRAQMSARTLARRMANGHGPKFVEAGRHRLVTEAEMAAWLKREGYNR